MKLKPHRFLTATLSGAIAMATIAPALVATPRANPGSSLSREPGAIYLEDFVDQRVELLAIDEVPIYATAQRQRALGTLKKGRKVVVVAMTDKQYQIRGQALHGQVKGWVFPSALASLDKDFVANLRSLYERQKIVGELIAENQIALGMNIDEVVASMGKPSRKNSKLNKAGRSDTYEYITYDRVSRYRTGYDRFGNLVQQLYYVKVESGKLSVSFKDEVVETIEETEGNPLGGGGVKIVPFPINLF
jgi:hypothetical protein